MESWFGGGILFAVAAVLWLAYLVPNWLHRREYIASERNAVRLQQTIRVLAETSEAPQAIRLESAAKARIVASKLAKRGVLAEARATVDVRVAAAERLRRTRLAVTLILAVSIAVLGWQGWLAATVGAEAVSALVVVLASLVAVASGVMQYGVNSTAQERSARLAAEDRALRATESRRAAEATVSQRRTGRQVAEQPSREWTPQRLPQPLGQVRREAMLAAAQAEARGQSAGAAEENARIAALEEHRRAAAVAAVASKRAESRPERAAAPARAAAPSRELVGVAPAAAQAPAPSRYAAMGIVDHAAAGAVIDLDSAIARRRAS